MKKVVNIVEQVKWKIFWMVLLVPQIYLFLFGILCNMFPRIILGALPILIGYAVLWLLAFGLIGLKIWIKKESVRKEV